MVTRRCRLTHVTISPFNWTTVITVFPLARRRFRTESTGPSRLPHSVPVAGHRAVNATAYGRRTTLWNARNPRWAPEDNGSGTLYTYVRIRVRPHDGYSFGNPPPGSLYWKRVDRIRGVGYLGVWRRRVPRREISRYRGRRSDGFDFT